MDNLTQEGFINRARNLEPWKAIQEIGRKITGRSPEDIARINNETSMELVRALVGSRGQEAGKVLQSLTRSNQVPENAALASRNLAEMLVRAMTPAPGGVVGTSDMINALTRTR
jgi:hypothetical protein